MQSAMVTILSLLHPFTLLTPAVDQQPSEQTAEAALYAYHHTHSEAITNHNYMSIIDFSLPSDEDRYYLYDLKTNKSIYSALVAHGKGSGDGRYATQFSNRNGSHMSSLGMYVTTGDFPSKHGQSIHVKGLQASDNRAGPRHIEFHSANYVTNALAASEDVGHSFGCFAMSTQAMAHVRPYIDKGSAAYAYDSNYTYS